MRLEPADCWDRLRGARHGVLATTHPRRGVDAVPVVYAVAEGTIFVPVDTVKAKSGRRLQRLANIEADERCVLLVEHWSEDWGELWWVRLHGTASVVDARDAAGRHGALSARYEQYDDPSTIVGGIVITPTEMTGWAASAKP